MVRRPSDALHSSRQPPLLGPSTLRRGDPTRRGQGLSRGHVPDQPGGLYDLPSIHDESWEPLWQVCNDQQIVLNCLIGTDSAPPHPSLQSPIEAWITGMPISIANSASDWITLEALQRYPNLKMALSEGGIGWVPYLLERADFTHRLHGAWTNSSYGDKKPSNIFREHIITHFIEDDFGLANRHAIGIDNITLEVDYPHSDCLWPDYPEGLWRSIQTVAGGIPDGELDKITHENVLGLYRFDGMEKAGGRANRLEIRGKLCLPAHRIHTNDAALAHDRREDRDEHLGAIAEQQTNRRRRIDPARREEFLDPLHKVDDGAPDDGLALEVDRDGGWIDRHDATKVDLIGSYNRSKHRNRATTPGSEPARCPAPCRARVGKPNLE